MKRIYYKSNNSAWIEPGISQYLDSEDLRGLESGEKKYDILPPKWREAEEEMKFDALFRTVKSYYNAAMENIVKRLNKVK